MDTNTMLTLLMVLVTAGGGLIMHIMKRQNDLSQLMNEHKIKVAENYVTKEHLDKRFDDFERTLKQLLQNKAA
jgi:hypothetical protein